MNDTKDTRRPFASPEINPVGELRKVTANASEEVISDRRLKTDIEAYDKVLPRVKKLS